MASLEFGFPISSSMVLYWRSVITSIRTEPLEGRAARILFLWVSTESLPLQMLAYTDSCTINVFKGYGKPLFLLDYKLIPLDTELGRICNEDIPIFHFLLPPPKFQPCFRKPYLVDFAQDIHLAFFNGIEFF